MRDSDATRDRERLRPTRCLNTCFAHMVGAGGGRGYGRAERLEDTPMRLAVTAEQENGDHRIQIRGYMGYIIYMGVEYGSWVSCFQ